MVTHENHGKMQASSFARSLFTRSLAPVLLAMAPELVWAEGAVRSLDCKVSQVCDAAGVCESAAEAVNFRMAPESLREDGSGTFEISYRETRARMEAYSYAGPFIWNTELERNTVLASSETRFLWHQLVLGSTPAASVRFMECSLR